MSFQKFPNRGKTAAKRRWRFRRPAVAGRVGRTSHRFARVGAEEITAKELVVQMDLLNAQAESLNVSATAAKVSSKGAGFPFKKWDRFLNARLPTNALSSVVVPIYEDGPIGWRQWHKGNRKAATSTFARLFSADSTWRVMNEYKSSVAAFYAAAKDAGIPLSMKAPGAPTVADMPGPIDPVEIPGQAVLEDMVSPLLGEGTMQARIASALGLTPEQLRRVTVGGFLAAALAAAYAVSQSVRVPR